MQWNLRNKKQCNFYSFGNRHMYVACILCRSIPFDMQLLFVRVELSYNWSFVHDIYRTLTCNQGRRRPRPEMSGWPGRSAWQANLLKLCI